MEKKFKKLPAQLAVALGQYMINSLLSRKRETGTSYRSYGGKMVKSETFTEGRPWDKQADLKRIDEVAASLGWGFSAIAGTFWFTPKGVKNYSLEIHEEIWPLAEVKPREKA